MLRKVPSSQGEPQSVVFIFTFGITYGKNSLLRQCFGSGFNPDKIGSADPIPVLDQVGRNWPPKKEKMKKFYV